MSIFQIDPSDVEQFTVVTNPFRNYTSSSVAGVTGSVYVFARHSEIEKEVQPVPSFIESVHDDADLSTLVTQMQAAARSVRLSGSGGDISPIVSQYMSGATAQGSSARKHKTLPIIRFTPTFSYTQNTISKLIIKDILNPYYRTSYPTANWAYTNYHSLNFFTSSNVPTSSVLMYPNVEAPVVKTTAISGVYALHDKFSFDFHINPRYQQDNVNGDFKAGTIFHLSSCYAVSLVSGSGHDINGRATGFRIMLQLSHSADIAPSKAVSGGYPNDLVFLSDDNSLQLNNWHRVVIRWGGTTVNSGSGSFNIDSVDRGTFPLFSASIAPAPFTLSGNPDILCIGNFYEGTNAGSSAQAFFFAADTGVREGLNTLIEEEGIDEPDFYKFQHPLRAELHDLFIKNSYMTDTDISASGSSLPMLPDTETAFWLRPAFSPLAPIRRNVGIQGGVLQTPFFEIDGTTNDPFNVAMAFGVGGHYINLENFTLDQQAVQWPRLFHLSASAIESTTDVETANQFLYSNPAVRYRNLFLLPCDDGTWNPPFDLAATQLAGTQDLVSLQLHLDKQSDDLGLQESSLINLDNLVSTASLILNQDYDRSDVTQNHAEDFMSQSIGFTPESPSSPAGAAYLHYAKILSQSINDLGDNTLDPGVQAGSPLTIFQRLRDPSSDQITFFDISNLYYGKRILPGSLTLIDSNMTGSGGPVKVTLKDDGFGGLYRADALTAPAKWNNVGNIYYSEGIIVIKSPHLYFFGADQFEIDFRGDQSLHVLKVHAMAPANMMNSSSNPSFKQVAPSGYANDADSQFVYISNIQLHDDNLNVVVKSQLAQPIVKRVGDRITFRVKVDF